MNAHRPIASQRGAFALLTALILLICISLVTLLSSKTVIVETQIAADNYRTSQAVAAANAALDYGIAYFDDGGFDHDDDGCPEYLADSWTHLDPDTNANVTCNAADPLTLSFPSADGTQTTTAELAFDNDAGTRCVPAAATANMRSGMIIATGFSDDRLAQRTVSQCVATLDVFAGNAPKQSLVTHGGVGLTGNYQLINRFYNTTAWSGEAVNIGASATASTFIRPVGTDEASLTRIKLEDDDTTNDWTSQAISDRDKGNGVDTIANDPRLSSLTGDEFFNNFFMGNRTEMRQLAADVEQVFADPEDAENVSADDPTSGVVWIEGGNSFDINGGEFGSPGHPVIMIINGNVHATGNPVIYGLLYIRGQLDAEGTVGVFGSVIVEGDPALVPAGEEDVVGHGGVDLIYTPYTLDRAGNPGKGLATLINGSWRDW